MPAVYAENVRYTPSMPTRTPLVLAFRSTLIALDRETGALRWKALLPMEVRRFFFHEGRVIAAIGYERTGAVHILEGVRGMSEARVELHFDPTGAAILKDGKLYLASNDAVACITCSGRLVFRGSVEEIPRGLFGTTPTLVLRDAESREIAQVEVGSGSKRGNAGLLLDELVSQPDMRD